MGNCVSNRNTSVSSRYCGFNSAVRPRSYASESGPRPDMQLCRLALPGPKSSPLPMYLPAINPRNSLATFLWNGGGRNVCSATVHRGGKHPNSMFDVPGTDVGDASTQ